MLKAADKLCQNNISADLLKLKIITPLNLNNINFQNYDKIYFFEEGIKSGGIGESFGNLCENAKFINIGFDSFVTHGNIEKLLEINNLSSEKIFSGILKNN